MKKYTLILIFLSCSTVFAKNINHLNKEQLPLRNEGKAELFSKNIKELKTNLYLDGTEVFLNNKNFQYTAEKVSKKESNIDKKYSAKELRSIEKKVNSFQENNALLKSNIQSILKENIELKAEIANLSSRLSSIVDSNNKSKKQIGYEASERVYLEQGLSNLETKIKNTQESNIQYIHKENAKLKTELGDIKIFFHNMANVIDGLEKQNKYINKNVELLKVQMAKRLEDHHLQQIKIQHLEAEKKRTEEEISSLNNHLSNHVEALGIKIQKNQKFIKETTNSTQNDIFKISQLLSKNLIYGAVGLLITVLFSVFIYWLLNKKQKIDKVELTGHLKQAKLSIEENLVKEFETQTDLINKQLKILEKQQEEGSAVVNDEPDHSLALRVASEITRIERNISFMDQKTKGLKQLLRSVERLKDNLLANDYEMPRLLGKRFNQGMNIIITSAIPDESLESGAEIISRVLVPQVDYKNKMIQAAQIEVSVGV